MDRGGWFKSLDLRGWIDACLPRPSLSAQQRCTLGRLGPRLTELGYSEFTIRDWLDGLDLSQRRFDHIPGYLLRLARADRPASALAGFGLLRQSLARIDLDSWLGSDVVAVLEHLGLLRTSGDSVEPLADLYPCQGRFLFADPKFSAYKRLASHVYEVGGDSYMLARTTPRRSVQRSLDLCLGSGVHAILAGSHSSQVWGVDINPRAIEMACLNAVLNGVEARFEEGDLYTPLQGRTFDLITANTPFVPAPRSDPLEPYRDGGESGEELNQRLVAGLSAHLNPGGTLALFTNFPLVRGSDFLDRVAGWLGGGSWGLALLWHATCPREDYIASQIQDFSPMTDPAAHRRRFERWVECYDRQQIDGMVEATLLIRRCPDEHPGFRQVVALAYPREAVGAMVGDWLEALERCSSPIPIHGPWRIHPQVQRVLTDMAGEGGSVSFSGWAHIEELSGAEVQAVREPAGADDEVLRTLGRRLVMSPSQPDRVA